MSPPLLPCSKSSQGFLVHPEQNSESSLQPKRSRTICPVSPPPSLSPAHSAPATQASSLFLLHARHDPAPGHLHTLYTLPGFLFLPAPFSKQTPHFANHSSNAISSFQTYSRERDRCRCLRENVRPSKGRSQVETGEEGVGSWAGAGV